MNFPSVFRVLKAVIRTRKDNKDLNLAKKEKQPKLLEPPCAKTVALTKIPVRTKKRGKTIRKPLMGSWCKR